MPASMIGAAVGSSPKVSGSRIAMVAIGPIPGRTPISVPSMQPAKQSRILVGDSAMPRPWPRFCRSSMRASEVDRERREHQHRDRLVKREAEQKGTGDRHRQRKDNEVARPDLTRAEAGDEHGKRRRDDEAGLTDRRGEEHDSGQYEGRPAQMPAFERVAILDETQHDEDSTADADRYRRPARHH